jgi:hypothetical protein
MVQEHEMLENVSLHVQKINYEEDLYELEDCVGEEALNLNLPLKLGLVKRIIPTLFFSHLLKNT